MEPAPFTTVPDEPTLEAVDVIWTRDLAAAVKDWRGLANRCGIAQGDMRRFLDGECMLTAPNREKIRGALR